MMIPAYPNWLEQDALVVAPRLLGCELIVETPNGPVGGTIVEVEAYHGEIDPASHAFRGQTTRTAPMFESGGHIYVYLSYGMHSCLNIVTGPAGGAQAVLIRGIEPTVGIQQMRTRRAVRRDVDLTNGPGKLAAALGINLADSGTTLGNRIKLVEHPPIPRNQISSGPRIGITKATDNPWRFWLTSSEFVSRR